MLFRPNPSSGVPIYLQLMEQVKHAIETGALRPGDQLPGIRRKKQGSGFGVLFVIRGIHFLCIELSSILHRLDFGKSQTHSIFPWLVVY